MSSTAEPVAHWEYFPQAPFTYEQRAHTTVLFGGLTFKHDRLIQAGLKALGYRSETLPTPAVPDFQTGKEYGNYGQCNPTYFTVGNLVNHLKRLEASGLSKDEIREGYVFVTASSPCGPCRFGMYQNEYRLATSNAGYEGFRVLTFDQDKDFTEEVVRQGLEINLDFLMAFLHAITLGDVLNEVAYAIRPYEVEEGATDAALEKALEHVAATLEALEPRPVTGPQAAEPLAKVYRHTQGPEARAVLGALEEAGRIFDAVDVDRTRVKPVVKITGEFWAQTTEGDGNFNMFPFLEREGSQVLVEPIATWAHYCLDQARLRRGDRAGLDAQGRKVTGMAAKARELGGRLASKAVFALAERLFKGHYERLGEALLGIPHALVDQQELAEISHGFYDTRAEGGEGHLEVGKTLYYTRKGLCHMVLSLKPFGCMPSTQSDGVQAAVQGAEGDLIFLPIETSGEGEVNAHSRVQMALGEAKKKAREEYAAALEATGLSAEEVAAYLQDHPELRRPSYKIPQHRAVVGVAANTVYHVKDLLDG